MLSVLSDPVGSVLTSALDGLSTRSKTIANNIANVDTPDFRATSVDFETALKSAISNGELATEVEPILTPTDTPVGPNGNNVDLRKETMAAIQNSAQYQVIARAVSDRAAMLKTVVGGQ